MTPVHRHHTESMAIAQLAPLCPELALRYLYCVDLTQPLDVVYPRGDEEQPARVGFGYPDELVSRSVDMRKPSLGLQGGGERPHSDWFTRRLEWWDDPRLLQTIERTSHFASEGAMGGLVGPSEQRSVLGPWNLPE